MTAGEGLHTALKCSCLAFLVIHSREHCLTVILCDADQQDSSDLEFWRSESWVQLWSGQPLNLPPPGSAADLVRRALLPGSKVDFPQITEICDLVGGSFPQEGPEAIKVLVTAMRDKESLRLQDVPFRKKLKALTITNDSWQISIYSTTKNRWFLCHKEFLSSKIFICWASAKKVPGRPQHAAKIKSLRNHFT
ncbi:unnamed protein product [Cladocopium goreaui]|uniref:Uncharacterized protein n=1 Tax=Cladocopium goreaui TaxID=2562237 RepID=A0A9P1BRM6_9DINO|nr:unnamed protein product [Cladocopium goreaui]